MNCFLRKLPSGELEGVIKTEFGREIVFEDLDAFLKCCPDRPPYFDFILRPKPVAILPIVWKDLLRGTAFEEDEDGNADMYLRDYQIECIERVVEEIGGRAIVAPEPGMGKTLIGCILSRHYGGKRLFVVPSGVVSNWMREYKRFFGKKAVIQHFDTRRSTIEEDVVITSISLFRDCPILQTHEWDFFLVDEAQNIKHDSGQGKAVCFLSPKTKACILMSGTPQEGSSMDLYNPLYCLYPAVFKDRETYIKRFSIGEYNTFKKWVPKGSTNQDELNLILGTLMVRMLDTRQDTLPPKHRYVQHMRCSGENMAAVKRLMNERDMCSKKLQALEREKASASRLQAHRLELCQISNQVRVLSGIVKASILGSWFEAFESERSDKEKYVFFVEHIDVRKALSETMDSIGFEYQYIDGGIKNVDRDKAMFRMQDPEDPLRVLIASYKTCSLGISFCPGTCYEIFVELASMPTMMIQAEKRINRDGALRDSHYIWLVLEGTTDENIVRTIQARYRDIKHVVDGERGMAIEFKRLPEFAETKRAKLDESQNEPNSEQLIQNLEERQAHVREELLPQ